jgi:hypothetical protein
MASAILKHYRDDAEHPASPSPRPYRCRLSHHTQPRHSAAPEHHAPGEGIFSLQSPLTLADAGRTINTSLLGFPHPPLTPPLCSLQQLPPKQPHANHIMTVSSGLAFTPNGHLPHLQRHQSRHPFLHPGSDSLAQLQSPPASRSSNSSPYVRADRTHRQPTGSDPRAMPSNAGLPRPETIHERILKTQPNATAIVRQTRA